MLLLQGPEQAVRLSLDEEGRIHRVAVAQTRAPHFYPGGSTYAGPLQFHGEYRLLAVLHNSTWAQGKLLKGEFAAFPLGKALGGPAPTAHAVGQGSGECSTL